MAKKVAQGKTGKRRGNGAARKASAVKAANQNGLFPIVGVGASAGGLEAFTELLKALPDNPQMAFVFIQHMAPTHVSMLPRLLSKATSMPVMEVTDGLQVEPNRVYIIPPNAGMTIAEGVLRLAARKEGAGKSLPIDDFFWALAEDRRSAAIGVILSGTASDGTQGMKAIKAAGGITFAQDLSARFPEMPRNAVAAGCVDFSLPPEKIAQELARMGRHPYIHALEEPEPREVSEMRDQSLHRICLLLRADTGVDFHLYKPATLARRVARRMALQKIDGREKYLKFLRTNRAEVNALYEDIFVHVTGFFRDPDVLAALRQTLLPRILESQQPEDAIRIWVSGCSSGEEVYSIAMILLEELGDRAGQKRIQIFGTDVSQKAIEQARNGIYQEAAISQISPERRRRFFAKVESGYQISKFVRDMCVFARHDVTKDPPFSKLDLISCRNVLIYLGPILQKRVAETFHYALKPTGFLLLGKSESLGTHANLFAADDPKLRIFSRKALAAPLYPTAAILEYALGQRTAKIGALSTPYDIRQEAERVLLERFVPAALVVDPDLQIIHFEGNTSRYLAPATGQPSFHLLRMVRPELVVDLRTALHEVKKTASPANRAGIRLKHNGSVTIVDLQVIPLPGRHPKDFDFLVVFHEAHDRRATEPEAPKAGPPAAKGRGSAPMLELQRELAATREQLRTIIEEHEATSEEMAAVNEEMVSSNEELQSTNEELETAKEELQSSNEELITLNDELQNRNAELGQLASDLSNLLVGVEIPVVILDNNLRIRRFTPTAEKVLNLIATDVGRPFTDLAPAIDIPGWKELASEVIERRRILEREVRDRQGHWYGLRMRPYQTAEHKVDGVLMALMDIDSVKRSLDEAREARDLAEDLVETVREPLLILDENLHVVKATRHYYETFGATAEETEGEGFFDLSGGQWNVPELRRSLEEVLPRDARVESFEVVREFPAIGYRCILLNARRILRPAAGKPMILVALEDITERKQAEEVLRQRDRVLQEATSQAIVSAGADGKIRMVNLRTSDMFGYSREELLDMPVDRLLPEGSQEAHARHRAEYLANPQNRPMGSSRELKGRRKDGTEFPISVHLSHIETKDGPLAVDIITDLTELKKAAETLQLTQERLSLAQEVAGIGVWDWDAYTNETRYSREWAPLYGLPAGTQPRSREDWLAKVHPDDREQVVQTRQQAIETGGSYSNEFRVVWPDGSTHWLQGRGTAFRDDHGAVVRLVGVSVDVTNAKRAEAERQTLLARQANAQEDERRRISRELHDELTQRLAGLAMEFGSLGTEFPAASERLKKRLRALQAGLVQAAEGARHVAHELHPSELDDLGLAAALRAYCDDFASQEGIAVEFHSDRLRSAVSRECASCLYRVTQESLRNVSKHAHASKAFVMVDETDRHIRLRVRDDGGGFSLPSLDATGGLGIVGMRERVRLANGTFAIRSEPGKGTEVTVELSLNE